MCYEHCLLAGYRAEMQNEIPQQTSGKAHKVGTTHLDLALIFLLFLLNFLIRFLRHFSRILEERRLSAGFQR